MEPKTKSLISRGERDLLQTMNSFNRHYMKETGSRVHLLISVSFTVKIPTFERCQTQYLIKLSMTFFTSKLSFLLFCNVDLMWIASGKEPDPTKTFLRLSLRRYWRAVSLWHFILLSTPGTGHSPQELHDITQCVKLFNSRLTPKG